MEDKKLNNQESLELITRMINQTKRQLHIGEGNLLLIWGYTSAIVALLVGILLYATGGHPAVNWLWFLIWIVGGTATAVISRRDKSRIEKCLAPTLIASPRACGLPLACSSPLPHLWPWDFHSLLVRMLGL